MKYENPFTEVEVDVVFKQGERQWKVPAFWAGDKKWTVRFSPPVQGKFTYCVECTDKANPGLNGKEQTLSVAAYKGDNPLLKRGFVKTSPGKKMLEQYPWHGFVPHPEWAPGCFAAGIPGEVRFIYLPRRGIYNWDGPEVKDLEPDLNWHVYYWDPATGRRFEQGVIKATAKAGDKKAKPVGFKKNVPSPQDWILVFERVER